MEANGSERRRFPRYNRRLGVSFTYEGQECVAQTVDLSKTGALFSAPLTPEPGTKLLLNLSDRKNPSLTLYLKAFVVRHQLGQTGETLFAAQFGDAIARDPRRLRRFLDSVLNISTGLIRVVDEDPDGEKAYAFSFDPVHKEGDERVKALQSSLFSTFDELEEADEILANFGRAPSGASVEEAVEGNSEKKKGFWQRRKEKKKEKKEKKKKGRVQGQGPGAGEQEEEAVAEETAAAKEEAPLTESPEETPQVEPAPPPPGGGGEVRDPPLRAVTRKMFAVDKEEMDKQARTQRLSAVGPETESNDQLTPQIEGHPASAMVRKITEEEAATADTMALWANAPPEEVGDIQTGEGDAVLVEGTPGSLAGLQDDEGGSIQGEELSFDVLLDGSEEEEEEEEEKQVAATADDSSISDAIRDEAPSEAPIPGSGGGGFLSKLAGLFGGGGGKDGSRGEKLISAGPLKNIVARDTTLSVVYRLGSSRHQAKAVRLYCAGLKCETKDILPPLYAHVTLLIPLTGAKKISQIELQADATRVRPDQPESDTGGIFEVRFSMRTDKNHLELYRALLMKMTGENPDG